MSTGAGSAPHSYVGEDEPRGLPQFRNVVIKKAGLVESAKRKKDEKMEIYNDAKRCRSELAASHVAAMAKADAALRDAELAAEHAGGVYTVAEAEFDTAVTEVADNLPR